MTVSVLIVDDQAGFRSLAREVLTGRGYTVVGEASCRSEALEAAACLHPEAVLLDVRLGDDSCLEVARALRGTCPDAAILLVSASLDAAARHDLLRSADVVGFVPKWRLASADLAAFWSPE